MKEACLDSAVADSGKGKSKLSEHLRHGYHLVKGKSYHDMEDYVFSQFKQVENNELGLFAIFDGHVSREIPDYLRSHLFENILKEPDFWTETEKAIKRAYRVTDKTILDKAVDLGKGGSTAVTAILINCQKLVVANVGDSRAVICRNGLAKQLSVDHEPDKERSRIEDKGGFVIKLPGDVARVDGELAVARAFGDKSLKEHLSSEPDVSVQSIDDKTEFFILASDGIWKASTAMKCAFAGLGENFSIFLPASEVMTNQEAVDCIKDIEDAQASAKRLAEEAVARNSGDDISCVVVKF